MNPFLSCTLMLPALGFHPILGFAHIPPDVPAHHRASFASFLRGNKRILLVGGAPNYVSVFRDYKLQAFGVLTEDRPGATKYHAVGNFGRLPFLPKTFSSVHVMMNNPIKLELRYELLDALKLIESGGLFVFNEDEYLLWPRLLKGRGWTRVPFMLGRMSTWEQLDTGGRKEGNDKEKGGNDGNEKWRYRRRLPLRGMGRRATHRGSFAFIESSA